MEIGRAGTTPTSGPSLEVPRREAALDEPVTLDPAAQLRDSVQATGIDPPLVDFSSLGAPGLHQLDLAARPVTDVTEPDGLPGRYSMPRVGSRFAGSITSAADMTNQPFSTGADLFLPTPENVDSVMELARSAIAQGHEPIIALIGMVLDEDKRLKPDADTILDDLKARFPDVMNRKGALFEAVDEVFWNRQPEGVSGAGSDARVRQAADDAIATLALLHEKLPQASLTIVACPEVWRTDLNSSQQANPTVIPEFKRILEHLRPGDVAATDPYAWTMDPHDEEAKLQAAQEFNDFVRANAPGVQTGIIPQGFVPRELAKPAIEWSPAETAHFSAFMDRMFTLAQSFDRTLVWGSTEPADGLTGIDRAPAEIRALYQRWALEIGGPPDDMRRQMPKLSARTISV